MLVANQSFSYVDPFDGQTKAVHRGRTRVAEGHDLARRFPHRFEPIELRDEARWRFADALDRVEGYDDYRRMLTDRFA
jgi:hypothetical protein